jgi:hypothetical protein
LNDRDEAMSALKQSNATVADDLETFMKMDDEDQSIALRVNHPDLLDWMQKSMLMDMDRTAEAEVRLAPNPRNTGLRLSFGDREWPSCK